MRYLNVPTMTFVDIQGNSYVVYQRRTIPSYQIAKTINRTLDEDFDEIWTRPENAGSGSEDFSFMLHESNITAILDAHLDYSRIKSIGVPVINDLGQ